MPAGFRTREQIIRKVKFSAVGMAGVAVSFVSLWIMINGFGMNHSIAYAIQTVLAIETNFLLNDRFTWRDRRDRPFLARAGRYHLTRIGLMVPINQVMFFFLQPPLGTTLANFICLAVTTIANWFLNDRFTFANKKPAIELVKEPA